MKGGTDRQTEYVSCQSLSLVPAQAWQRAGVKGAQPLLPAPTPQACKDLAGLGAAPVEGGSQGLPPTPGPVRRRLRALCGLAAGREPLRACRRSQEKQAARHPGRPSAVKCCISHKGGSQRALLREIRGTGKAEPSFNTRLIFMELRQRQPPCRERSRSAEGERRLPGKQLLAGRRVHLAHKTRRTRAAGGVPGPAGAGLRPAERP